MTKWLLVGIIVVCNCLADLMNTAGMRRQGEVHDLRPKGIARLASALVRNRFVIAGLIANGVGFFTLIMLLSIASVSFAVPATAASIVVETGLAKLLLNEDVRWQRWVGVAAIACGVALLALP